MSINMPTIKLGKYSLREIKIDDYIDFYEIGNSLENTRYITWGPFNNVMESYYFLNERLNSISPNMPNDYVIIDNSLNKVIGQIGYHTYYPSTNCAELGFIINKEYSGLGIMTKCLKKMIDLGFEYLNYNKILVGHMDNNIASKRVIEKCDFKYEGLSLNIFYDKVDGTPHNVIYYSIYKEDYERGMLKWQ